MTVILYAFKNNIEPNPEMLKNDDIKKVSWDSFYVPVTPINVEILDEPEK